MPEVLHAQPVLAVSDLAAAVATYRGMGFEVVPYDDGYAWVRSGGHEQFHLRRVDALDPATNSAAAYLHTRQVDEWFASVADHVVVLESPTLQPWGMYEFAVRDPWGNTLRFGTNR